MKLLLTLLVGLSCCSAFSQGYAPHRRKAFQAAAGGGGGGFSLLFTNVTAGDASGTTTTAGDTSGCTLLVVCVAYYNSFSGSAITDNKGNTWTQRADNTGNNGNYRLRVYECVNGTVGSGHTFTTTGNYSVLLVSGYSGNGASPFDTKADAAFTDSGQSLATGSITPAQDGELILVPVVWATSSGVTTFNQSTTTISGGIKNTGGSLYAGLAYKFQSTAAAINVTATTSAGSDVIRDVIAAWK
jgi:hypothetical protein